MIWTFGVCALATPQVKASAQTIVNRRLRVRVRVVCIDESRYKPYKFLFISFAGTLDYLPDIDREYNRLAGIDL